MFNNKVFFWMKIAYINEITIYSMTFVHNS